MEPLSVYRPQNQITHTLKENYRVRANIVVNPGESAVSAASDIVSKTLVVRYEGAVNIGDRVIIEREISNPQDEILNRATLEVSHYNHPSFVEWLCNNKCLALKFTVCCLCFAPCCFYGAYSNDSDELKEKAIIKRVSELTNIFYEEQVVMGLKEADTIVEARIKEEARVAETQKNMLIMLNRQRLSSAEEQATFIDSNIPQQPYLTQNIHNIRPSPTR